MLHSLIDSSSSKLSKEKFFGNGLLSTTVDVGLYLENFLANFGGCSTLATSALYIGNPDSAYKFSFKGNRVGISRDS